MTTWAAEVQILDGHYWHPTTWRVAASSAHHAARNAVEQAKARLPKRTRITEVRLTLRRLAAVAPSPETATP